jgi:hypothetical protein
MSRNPLPECLLEMNYFRLLLEEYKQIMNNPNIVVFKPTTVQEKWYGFDQSFISTANGNAQIADDIKGFIHNDKKITDPIYQAVFLQFKVVDRMQRRSARMPPSFETPYYRSELYLDRNKDTGLSQHETLLRISKLENGATHYVCPMIFSIEDVRRTPAISDLQFVDIRTAPSGWVTTEKHAICFQTPQSVPVWCSDPIPGESLTWRQVVESLTDLSEDEVFSLIAEAKSIKQSLGDFNKLMLQSVESEPNPLDASMVVFAREA